MPIVVHAMTEENYQQWLVDKKQQMAEEKAKAELALSSSMPMDQLMAIGEQAYLERCAVCHQTTGLGIPSVFPAIKGSKIATGDLSTHIDTVVNGRPGTAMQAFINQMTQQELAAVITYQRNAGQ